MMKRISLLLIRYEWLILAVLAPLLLFPNAKRSLALVGVPLLWAARKIARGRFIRRTPLDWAILLLLIMVLVSLFVTYDLSLSLPKVTALILGIALYYATVDLDSPRSLRLALAIYLVGGIGLAVVALFGTTWSAKIPVLGSLAARLPAALRGLPGSEQGFNANEVAGTLLWFIPFYPALAAWAWSGWRRGNARAGWPVLLLLAGGVLTTGVLLLSQSRGALLGVGLASLLLLAASGRYGRGLAAALILAAVVVLALYGPRIGNELLGAGSGAGDTGQVITLSARVEIWSRALDAVADFPITGMGFNVFRNAVTVMYPLFSISPDVDIAHAHNHFLQVAVDLGLPGLTAYLAIWLIAGVAVIGLWRGAGDTWVKSFALGSGASLLAYLVYGMTDTVSLGSKPGVAWWALLGLSMAVLASCAQPVESASTDWVPAGSDSTAQAKSRTGAK